MAKSNSNKTTAPVSSKKGATQRELILGPNSPLEAVYGPIFKITASDRDIFVDIAQPGVEEKTLILVSRIAIPLKTAGELVEALKQALKEGAEE